MERHPQPNARGVRRPRIGPEVQAVTCREQARRFVAVRLAHPKRCLVLRRCRLNAAIRRTATQRMVFQPAAGQVAGESVPLLFTPSQAAQLLQVRESWLRRRAARRLVPCTFLGKHLRFSRADLDAIATGAARSPDRDAGTISRGRARPGAKGRASRKVGSYDHFGDEHI